MKKQTITGQIYSVTASESCSYCEVRVKKNGGFYCLLSLKPNEQGTFQAISDEVEINGDEKAIILPFNAARSAVVGTGNKGENKDIDLVLSSHRESIGLLESGVHALIMQDELHNEKFSEIENDLLEIHSAIENDFTLSENLKESLSLISTDEFRSFAEWAQWDNAQTDLLKICQGDFSAHINDTSLHGGGSGSNGVFVVTAQTLTGEQLAPPPPPLPNGVTATNLSCVIDLNVLATYLESAGYNFCDENGGSSSGGSSETYNRFVVTMEKLPEIDEPGFLLGDISSTYDTLTINGKNFVGKIHSGENYSNSYGTPMTFDGDGEVTLKEFVTAFHEKISSLWPDEQHDLIHIIPSYRYEW